MPANIVDLLRRNQTITQSNQSQVETHTTYAIALEDSESGLVKVEFIGGDGTLANPQDTPDEGVVILTDDDVDATVDDDVDATGQAQSGSSDNE